MTVVRMSMFELTATIGNFSCIVPPPPPPPPPPLSSDLT